MAPTQGWLLGEAQGKEAALLKLFIFGALSPHNISVDPAFQSALT